MLPLVLILSVLISTNKLTIISECPTRQLFEQLGGRTGILCTHPSFSTRFFRLPCSDTKGSTTQLYTRFPYCRVSFFLLNPRGFAISFRGYFWEVLNFEKKHALLKLWNFFSEKADIAPLLDVEDMMETRRPDWKCVFTYVQSIYRRFKDEDWWNKLQEKGVVN